jgi:hypothetical protein
MFLIFSPYSFLYFSFYIIFMFGLTQISRFYYYWAIIEIIILLFIGLRYSLMIRSYAQLMIYFLIQTIASFIILVFYLYDLSILITLAFVLKLSIFPFFIWYINVIYRLPNFIFWLASTLHKIPPILIIKMFSLNLNYGLVWSSILFTTFLIGFIIMSVYDFRMLLVLSSIGNNSWLILRQIVHMLAFVLYITVYSLCLYFVILSFGSMSKFSTVKSLSLGASNLSFWVLTLSGMPPFPLFYCKILVIMTLFFSLGSNYIFVVFLLFSAFIFIAYLKSLIKYYVYSHSVGLSYFLKY